MTLSTDLILYGSISVGSGLDESPEYPIVEALDESVRMVSPESASTYGGGTATGLKGGYREITWRTTIIAVAADLGGVAALKAAVIEDLCRNNQLVTLRQNQGFLGGGQSALRTMPASGAAGGAAGSIAGYPRVSVRVEREAGTVIWFGVEAVTQIPELRPLLSGYQLVSHSQRIRTEVRGSRVTTRVSGTVRVAPTQVAQTYISTLIVTPAQDLAVAVGRDFSASYDYGDDPSTCSYEYVDGPVTGVGGGLIVLNATVDDRTSKTRDGRIERSISGSAQGAGATTFATGQRPSVVSGELLVRDEIGQPSGPDGTVAFSYGVLMGKTGVAGFASEASLLSYRETIEHQPQGRELIVVRYPDAQPLVYREARTETIVRQSVEAEFFGATAASAEASALMGVPVAGWADYQSVPDRFARETPQPGVIRLSIAREFKFPSAAAGIPGGAIPAAREVSGL